MGRPRARSSWSIRATARARRHRHRRRRRARKGSRARQGAGPIQCGCPAQTLFWAMEREQVAIDTAQGLMDEADDAIRLIRAALHHLDRIQMAEVMEEDISEVEFRNKIDSLVQLAAELADHDMLGGRGR